MIHFIGIMIASLILATSSCYGQQDENDWQLADDYAQPTFDSDWREDQTPPCIVKTNEEESESSPQVNDRKINKDSSLLISGANARRLINVVTVGYALINMHAARKKLNAPRSSMFNWVLDKLPSCISTPNKEVSFLTCCFEITCEALVYKTVAQWIVSIVEGDFIDFAVDGFKRVAHHAF
jgi:hypothetical protein